jgi:hypothetical protein
MNNKKRSSPQQSSDSDVEEMEDIFAQRKARQAHNRANNVRLPPRAILL